MSETLFNRPFNRKSSNLILPVCLVGVLAIHGIKKATVFMKTFGIMVRIAFIISISHTTSGQSGAAPEIVNIGALDTTIGKIAKSAIELAAEDINSDQNFLKGTQLFIDIRSSKQNAVQGAFAGW
jgi:hypothetical protein